MVAYQGPAEYVPLAAHSCGLLLNAAVVAFSSFAVTATRKSNPPNFGDQYWMVFEMRRWNWVEPPSRPRGQAPTEPAPPPTPVTVPPDCTRLSQFAFGLEPVVSPLPMAGPLW